MGRSTVVDITVLQVNFMIRKPNVIKNKCKGCSKFILMHNKILTCKSCETIVHSKCSKNLFQYNQTIDHWQCNDCIANLPARYNPFASILIHDKHEPVHTSEFEDISEISKIHESCKTYDFRQLSNLMKLQNNEGRCPSAIFNNIDGNASNFDTFVTEIAQIDHTFSIIGIAETNIDSNLKDLYKIPGYISEYNDKFPEKSKGSGVGLYIRDCYIYNRIDHLCICTPNLESVFVSITNMDKPQTIGVLYRPPGGARKML